MRRNNHSKANARDDCEPSLDQLWHLCTGYLLSLFRHLYSCKICFLLNFHWSGKIKRNPQASPCFLTAIHLSIEDPCIPIRVFTDAKGNDDRTVSRTDASTLNPLWACTEQVWYMLFFLYQATGAHNILKLFLSTEASLTASSVQGGQIYRTIDDSRKNVYGKRQSILLENRKKKRKGKKRKEKKRSKVIPAYAYISRALNMQSCVITDLYTVVILRWYKPTVKKKKNQAKNTCMYCKQVLRGPLIVWTGGHLSHSDKTAVQNSNKLQGFFSLKHTERFMLVR